MSYNPVITEIPATIDIRTFRPLDCVVKLRVAAYARVSTDSEDQLSSYKAQVEYYTEYIQANPNWIFVKIYTDEGLSGTSTKKRDGFNNMVQDALDGKIDLILTKSVTRFVRNTVDGLVTIRKLREKGVDIHFEELNLHTLDINSEMVITNYLSHAQEESHRISDNVTRGIRWRMETGKFKLRYHNLLGLEEGPDGQPRIVEEGAEVIRLIYSMFLEWRSYNEIAARLTAEGVSTPRGNTKWSTTTVRSILQNEKYAGNALLQKTYTLDFLTKKQKVNRGEVAQHYVEGSHPAIISPATFTLVQDEILRREAMGKMLSGSGPFFGKIICGECNGIYGSKVWNSNKEKYRRRVWQCNNKYGSKTHCPTPYLSEDDIKSVFVRAWNTLLAGKEGYISNYEDAVTSLADTSGYDENAAILKVGCEKKKAQIRECIRQNAAFVQDQSEYQKQYDELVASHNAIKEELDVLLTKKEECIVRKEKILRFLSVLDQNNTPLDSFDEGLWRKTVDSITVYSQEDVVVCFHSGTEIFVSVGGQ